MKRKRSLISGQAQHKYTSRWVSSLLREYARVVESSLKPLINLSCNYQVVNIDVEKAHKKKKRKTYIYLQVASQQKQKPPYLTGVDRFALNRTGFDQIWLFKLSTSIPFGNYAFFWKIQD